jgi:hypothetical protein
MEEHLGASEAKVSRNRSVLIGKNRLAQLAASCVTCEIANHDSGGSCQSDDDERDADVRSFHEQAMSRPINSNRGLFRLRARPFEDNRRRRVMLGVTKCD